MSVIDVLVRLVPIVLSLLDAIPGFEKTVAQFKADITGNTALSTAQKAVALGQAKNDVDAADDEVQAVDTTTPTP